MKKILFGIALILFGFCLAYISVQGQWIYIQLPSLGISVIGLVYAICGFVEKEN